MNNNQINPWIFIPIISIIIGLIALITLIPSESSNSKLRSKILSLQYEISTLEKIENPTKHNNWHIQHLKKTMDKLKKYDTPEFLGMNHHALKPLSSVIVIAIVGLLYLFNSLNKTSPSPSSGLSSNSNRIRPANDPIAEKTFWQSMSTGASNFKMQHLKATSFGLIIKPSFEVKLFYSAFLFGGLLPILLDYILRWDKLEFLLDPILSPYSIFTAVGMILRWFIKKNRIEFNKDTRIIQTPDQKIPFNDIHALQVITSLAGGRGQGIYKCNELNIVLANGQRINLLNHGDELEFEDQERQLSKLLNVPVWQA